MTRLLLIAVLLFGAWKGFEHFQAKRAAESSLSFSSLPFPSRAQPPSASFSCDGRKYCSQMTSCAEATYFLKNCPGAKMDGNNDGVPCERQWCR